MSVMMPPSISSSPTRATRRGDAAGQTFGTPAAATSSATDSGMIRSPVSIAESSSTTLRNSGTMKNTPACSRNWKKNMIEPAGRAAGWRASSGSISGSLPSRIRRRCQMKNSHTTNRPKAMSQKVGEMPEQRRRRRAWA